MSRQSEAKEAQGYVAKAIPQTCVNCCHFESEMVKRESRWMDTKWNEEKNLRCGIGRFAVKKMGTCNEWAGKVEKPQP